MTTPLLPAVAGGTPLLDVVHHCDALAMLKAMPSSSVNCIVTSPPYYGLRNYGVDGQIGLEQTPAAYVTKMVELFREARRVLRDDGTFWLNLGDSYATAGGNRKGNLKGVEASGTRLGGIRPEGFADKNLMGIPWRVAFGLQDDGWILRSEIIWHKPNPMPESVTDRPTKSHETIFLLTKSPHYCYDADAIRERQDPKSLERLKRGWNGNGERGYPGGVQNHLKNYMGKTDEEIAVLPGRNKRTVWTVPTKPLKEAHFAAFPPRLIEPMILAGCPIGGVVLDMFGGSGTTGLVARKLQRHFILCDLNPEYVDLARRRLARPQQVALFPEAA